MENTRFDELGLSPTLMKAIEMVGYEAPTPIQVQTIPLLLEGKDVIGQAQTGTGKTAAFALPILQKLDLPAEDADPASRKPRAAVQALVLTPTRELALQVAEAFYTYARALGAVRVLPVYGGQSIGAQISRLERGVHIVVGTPGRVMDHLRRGTLDFSALRMVVLDEADEMLRMGFIDDVEWILGQAPDGLQKALFSATMPDEIRRVADRYLHQPALVEIQHKTLTAPDIYQRYLIVSPQHKVEALTSVLETESTPGEGVLVFAHTKVGAADLAEKLSARGFAAEAIHGDLNQPQRENVVRRLRSGALEIVVATDVAARGWDVERIGMVINFDIPYDAEAYVHRIGRTGRAGRAGKAILFVTPRQKRLLRDIERFTGQPIEPAPLPNRAAIAARRIELFKQQILKTLDEEELDLYLNLVVELAEESGHDLSEIAAAAARMARGDRPLQVALEPVIEPAQAAHGAAAGQGGMVRLFIDAGRMGGVRPGDIVGAIANEAGVPGSAIGAIDIYDRFSFVDIPAQYLAQVLEGMDGATIRSREARIRVATPRDEQPSAERRKDASRPGRGFKPHPTERIQKKPRKR